MQGGLAENEMQRERAYHHWMKALLLVLLTLTACTRGQAPQQSPSLSLQKADLAAIPGSTREVYANVVGTSNLEVTWKVSGGCTLESSVTNAKPQRVTAPDKGASCSLRAAPLTNETPSFQSAVSCKVTATSVANPALSASIVIPVCDPKVTLSTFPATTVLYRNQYAVIQSDLRGTVSTGVKWTITQNPGGAGVLAGGSENRHAVFSANAAGTYMLTATSVADPSRKAQTTIYVTSHDLPAPNGDHTEAVDCTAVGGGRVFDVGPSHKYADLNAVPWPELLAGDTVRIHNDDATGSNPTVYRQHVAIAATGAPGKPLRVCGVPDAKGVKPIVDAQDATTRPDENWQRGLFEDRAVFVIFDARNRWNTGIEGNSNILIEGLHIRNGNDSATFIKSGTGARTPYIRSVSCIYIENGRSVMVRGNEIENCNQPVLSNAQTPSGGGVTDLTIEGNYMHGWGWKGGFMHGMYLQGIGVQVQFNYIGSAVPLAASDAVKSRSVMNFLRWNFVELTEPTTARVFDLTEPQAFNCYVIPHDFAHLYHLKEKSDCLIPRGGAAADPITADEIAANFEAYHSDYIYGNILDDVAGSKSAYVHYGYDLAMDSASGFDRRGGTLFYWNNTHLFQKPGGTKVIFDPMIPDYAHSYEYPSFQSLNNVFAAKAQGSFQWTRPFWSHVNVDSNWAASPMLLPVRRTSDEYAGATPPQDVAKCSEEGICKPSNGRMTWTRNGKPSTSAATVFTGPSPFNFETFEPAAALRGKGAELPSAIRDQPSNMQYFPATNRILPRKDASVLGALE